MSPAVELSNTSNPWASSSASRPSDENRQRSRGNGCQGKAKGVVIFVKKSKLKVENSSIVIEIEKEMGEIIAEPDVIQDIMTNSLVIQTLQDLGCTHWEIKDVILPGELPNGRAGL